MIAHATATCSFIGEPAELSARTSYRNGRGRRRHLTGSACQTDRRPERRLASVVVKCTVVSSAMDSHPCSVWLRTVGTLTSRSVRLPRRPKRRPGLAAERAARDLDQSDPDTRHCVTDVVFADSSGASALVGGCRLSQPRAGAKIISKNAISRCDTCWSALAL